MKHKDTTKALPMKHYQISSCKLVFFVTFTLCNAAACSFEQKQVHKQSNLENTEDKELIKPEALWNFSDDGLLTMNLDMRAASEKQDEARSYSLAGLSWSDNSVDQTSSVTKIPDQFAKFEAHEEIDLSNSNPEAVNGKTGFKTRDFASVTCVKSIAGGQIHLVLSAQCTKARKQAKSSNSSGPVSHFASQHKLAWQNNSISWQPATSDAQLHFTYIQLFSPGANSVPGFYTGVVQNQEDFQCRTGNLLKGTTDKSVYSALANQWVGKLTGVSVLNIDSDVPGLPIAMGFDCTEISVLARFVQTPSSGAYENALARAGITPSERAELINGNLGFAAIRTSLLNSKFTNIPGSAAKGGRDLGVLESNIVAADGAAYHYLHAKSLRDTVGAGQTSTSGKGHFNSLFGFLFNGVDENKVSFRSGSTIASATPFNILEVLSRPGGSSLPAIDPVHEADSGIKVTGVDSSGKPRSSVVVDIQKLNLGIVLNQDRGEILRAAHFLGIDPKGRHIALLPVDPTGIAVCDPDKALSSANTSCTHAAGSNGYDGKKGVLTQTPDNTIVFGKTDDDRFAYENAQEIFGGSGNDTITVAGKDSSVRGQSGDDVIVTSEINAQYVTNGQYSYTVPNPSSAQGNRKIFGGPGNDTIILAGDADQAYGGENTDNIWLLGKNSLGVGGQGNDTFHIEIGKTQPESLILDFSLAEGDRLAIHRLANTNDYKLEDASDSTTKKIKVYAPKNSTQPLISLTGMNLNEAQANLNWLSIVP